MKRECLELIERILCVGLIIAGVIFENGIITLVGSIAFVNSL